MNNLNPQQSSYTYKLAQYSLHFFAILTLIVIIWLNILLWPVPYTGLKIDPESGIVISVEQDSSASKAGFQLNDHVIKAYGLPWSSVITQFNLLSLLGKQGENIVFLVERSEKQITLLIPYGNPSLSFQIEKIANILLSLICWLTGYLIGVNRRHDSHQSTLIAFFWILVGLISGAYLFAYYASLPVVLLIQLTLINIIFPFSIYIHVYFPYRYVPVSTSNNSASIFMIYTISSTTISLLAIFTLNLSPIAIANTLSIIWPILILISFIAVIFILFKTYNNSNIAHIRRKVQFIISSCSITAILWLSLLEIPMFINKDTNIDQRVNIIAGLIPISYFLSTRDVYRINLVITRILSHALTIFSLFTFFLLLRFILNINDLSPLLTALFLVALYQPSLKTINSILPGFFTNNPYNHIDDTIKNLTSTLNQPELIQMTTNGITKTFSDPAVAFYKGESSDITALSLQLQHSLTNLPHSIQSEKISTLLRNYPSSVIENRSILASITQYSLSADEEQLLHHLGIVLWCPIVHAQGYLLGVFLIGMRGDLDPYRSQDIQELQRLLSAVSLALTNSAAYEEQQKSEALIRQLYQRLQESQDKMSTDIAYDIHDEVINGSILLNTQSISRIISDTTDTELRNELSLILETELSVIESLRMICQRLQLVNIEDPMGLPNVVRNQIQRLTPLWDGDCQLLIENTPTEIDPKIQVGCIRVIREALNNTIKHANATSSAITISYPSISKNTTDIIIKDNGKSANKAEYRPGHLGLQNMHEVARSIGGKLQIISIPGQGTTIVLTFSS